MSYVKVPRGLIEEKDLGDKRVLIYVSALFLNCNENSVDSLIAFCGYSSDRHCGSVRSQFDNALRRMVDRGYLQIVRGHIAAGRKRDCFGAIYLDEFVRIMKAREMRRGSEQRINHAHTLLLLSCVRCHMFRSPDIPQIYSNLLKRISENIGISVRSISGCVRALEDLDILHSEELPRYKDENGLWHSNVRIFVNRQCRAVPSSKNYDWRQVTRCGIQMILRNQVN